VQTSKSNSASGTAVSPPYLDANGAGLVLTVSSAVLAPRDQDSDELPYKMFGVMGADIEMNDFNHYMMSSFPECGGNMTVLTWSCIAIDTAGAYFIA